VISLSSLVHAEKTAPRAAVACKDAAYAAFKYFRAKYPQTVLTGLGSALDASTVTALGGLPCPVKFLNQGALEARQRAFSSAPDPSGPAQWRGAAAKVI
jgi:hypothetical protein